ncbi:AAA family ATPase, partial [bacterium]|nr:AAA family ATPase [bacterium]
MLRKLPIGQQDFSKIRLDNSVYADKTKIIYNMVTLGDYYFLSRPRRFGKSLLISTLKNLFEGKKELFKGLLIENDFDWKEVPVVRIDFNGRSFTDKPLTTTIDKFLDDNAERYKVQLCEQGNRDRFFELIKKLHEKTGERVVLLIDEYDKPIVDLINDIQKAEENREILRNFYGAVKGCSEMLKFVLITGISRFSKMSIFSELNNLADISMDENFAAICGFTKDDLNNYFSEYKDLVSQKLEISKDELDEKIRFWYDGYKFDGKTHIYNPFSILNFFRERDFRNYWFESGLPKLLADFIIQNGIDVRELHNVAMSAE